MLSTDDQSFENVLIALADPTRRQLLDHIAFRGQATATTLTSTVTISRQAIVKHLTVLDDAGLVSCVRVGREVRYSVCPHQLSSTAEWMGKIAKDWDKKLDWIKHMAEADDNNDSTF